MRGEVLKTDGMNGPGQILGDDGRTYRYIAARVHKGAALAPGSAVDFIALGDEARDIYPLTGRRPEALSASIDAAYVPTVAAKPDWLPKYFLRALSSNYFQFYGRARRAEYWSFILFFVVFLVALFFVDVVIATVFFGIEDLEGENFFPVLSGLFYVYALIPSISVTVRRLHDQDISGWLLLVNLVPYIGWLIVFILMFFNSHVRPNKHGPSPKYGGAQTVQVFA
ncbi:MAG: DUF805 domain-containing protein [Hyphomonas sp.]